jgi:hypothetical protein
MPVIDMVPVFLGELIVMERVEPREIKSPSPALTLDERQKLLELRFRLAKKEHNGPELCQVAVDFLQLAYERLGHASNLVPAAKEALLEAPLAIY